jgi:hypothetical protein
VLLARPFDKPEEDRLLILFDEEQWYRKHTLLVDTDTIIVKYIESRKQPTYMQGLFMGWKTVHAPYI